MSRERAAFPAQGWGPRVPPSKRAEGRENENFERLILPVEGKRLLKNSLKKKKKRRKERDGGECTAWDRRERESERSSY